ncbi:proton-coupled folate transporter-like [Haliotis rubra]|uniref:proton-coupled folate transporter-like n=1 Tax=Haliotis rubra TaxID=36100 RepID=UPI001EE4EB46|nr:proton-coupled folate transporter-like [Haliotis rubra]XP_046571894.1 proton-coupled folate transporter-like [Haliotis rubra]
MAVIRCGRRQFDLNLITVEPVLFLYMIGSFLTYPTFQAFVYKKVCNDRYNQTFCTSMRNGTFQEEHKTEEDYVQSQASYWILKNTVVDLVPSCLTVLFLYGSWGDKVGRKLPVIIPCLGAALSSIVYLLLSIYPSSKLEYLLIGALVKGLSGGFPTLLMSVYSYVSHIADPSNKTMRIGILESMTFFAGTVGVFISGVMLDNTSYMFVFAFISVSFFLGMVYAIIRLENITANTRRREGEGVCMYWCLTSVLESGRCVMKKREEKKNLYIFLALIIFIIIVMGTSCEIDVLLLYTRRPPLSWSQTTFGYFKGLENFTRSLTLVTVLPLCRKMRDTTVGLWGLASKIIGLVVLGLSTKTWLTFLVVIFAMFQGFPATVVRSLMSSMVSQGEQGRLFGLVAAVESIASLLASLLFNQLYPLSLGFFPGFCFLLAAGLFVIAVALMLWLHLDSQRLAGYKTLQEDQTDTDSPESDRYVIVGEEEVKANHVTGGPDQI